MRFILISDAVRITGLERQTIRNWIDRGIIPSQKINGTFYVDQDTFEALSGQMRDVDAARVRLGEERDRYLRDIEEYRKRTEDARMGHNVTRWLSICVNSGMRTAFFRSVLSVMCEVGMFSERDRDILSSVLDGTDLNEIARFFGITRERVRQIAEKTIHKTRDVMPLLDRIRKTEDYEREIRDLKDEISVLRKMAYRNTVMSSVAALTDKERRLLAMDRNALNDLLSMRLDQTNVSQRSLRALMYNKDGGIPAPIRTLGELCRMSEQDILSLRNAGKKCLSELTELLESNGLTWRMDIDSILKAGI